MPSPSKSAAGRNRSGCRYLGPCAGEESPERPPGLGPLAPERAELALLVAPEVHQAVAVQVGRVDLVDPREGLDLAAGGGLEHGDYRRVGVGGPLALRPPDLGVPAVEREGQERPAVRAAAPPLGPRQGRGLVRRDGDVPPPEGPSVLPREGLDVDPLGLDRAPLVEVCRRPAEEDRRGQEVAAAVPVQVGRLIDARQAVLPDGRGADGSDPSRPAGRAVDHPDAMIDVGRVEGAGVGHDDLGAAVAVEVGHDRPGVGFRQAEGGLKVGVDPRGPERAAGRDRERREGMPARDRRRSCRDELGLAIAVEVGVLGGPDRLEAEVDRAGVRPPGRRVQAPPAGADQDPHGRALPARQNRGRPVPLVGEHGERGIDGMAPERLPRPARDGLDDPTGQVPDVPRPRWCPRGGSPRGLGGELLEPDRGDEVGDAVAVEVGDRGLADDPARPDGGPDRAGQVRAFGIGASGPVELGEVRPEDRPILPREGQESGPHRHRPDEVSGTVAVDVRRRVDEHPGLSRSGREPGQPGMNGARRLAGRRRPQGVPDDLAGHAVPAAQPGVRPLDEVGLVGRQLDRRRVGGIDDWLLPGKALAGPRLRRRLAEHPAVIQADGMGDRLAAVHGDAIDPPEPAPPRDAKAVVAVGQGQRRANDELDRLADRLVGIRAEHLDGQRRAVVGQLDAAEPPCRVIPPGGSCGELEQHDHRDDDRRGADRLGAGAGQS